MGRAGSKVAGGCECTPRGRSQRVVVAAEGRWSLPLLRIGRRDVFDHPSSRRTERTTTRWGGERESRFCIPTGSRTSSRSSTVSRPSCFSRRAEKGLVRGTIARRFPRLGFERQKKLVSTDYHPPSSAVTGADAFRRLRRLQRACRARSRRGGQADGRRTCPGELRLPRAYRAWELLNLETWAEAFMEPDDHGSTLRSLARVERGRKLPRDDGKQEQKWEPMRLTPLARSETSSGAAGEADPFRDPGEPRKPPSSDSRGRRRGARCCAVRTYRAC